MDVTGSTNSLPRLIDQLAAKLLAQQSDARAGALAGRSLAELRAYLAGQSAYRRDRLSPRDGALLTVFTGTTYPIATLGRRSIIDADSAARLAPDSPDAWFALGDLLFHDGPSAGMADARDCASLHAYRHYLALRPNPDAERTAEVEQVRAELAKLQ